MFGRLHCCYVRHLTIFGNAYQIGASVYVRHIVMLLCMVDGNITKFDTLRCLEIFDTLQAWDMCLIMQCETMFVTLG